MTSAGVEKGPWYQCSSFAVAQAAHTLHGSVAVAMYITCL